MFYESVIRHWDLGRHPEPRIRHIRVVQEFLGHRRQSRKKPRRQSRAAIWQTLSSTLKTHPTLRGRTRRRSQRALRTAYSIWQNALATISILSKCRAHGKDYESWANRSAHRTSRSGINLLNSPSPQHVRRQPIILKTKQSGRPNCPSVRTLATRPSSQTLLTSISNEKKNETAISPSLANRVRRRHPNAFSNFIGPQQDTWRSEYIPPGI